MMRLWSPWGVTQLRERIAHEALGTLGEGTAHEAVRTLSPPPHQLPRDLRNEMLSN